MSAKIIEIKEDITYANLPFHSVSFVALPTGLGSEMLCKIQFNTNSKLSNQALAKIFNSIQDIVLEDKKENGN